MAALLTSRPVWGAWIEIRETGPSTARQQSRPVWGAWIEIWLCGQYLFHHYRRAPYGARGLK